MGVGLCLRLVVWSIDTLLSMFGGYLYVTRSICSDGLISVLVRVMVRG